MKGHTEIWSVSHAGKKEVLPHVPLVVLIFPSDVGVTLLLKRPQRPGRAVWRLCRSAQIHSSSDKCQLWSKSLPQSAWIRPSIYWQQCDPSYTQQVRTTLQALTPPWGKKKAILSLIPLLFCFHFLFIYLKYLQFQVVWHARVSNSNT